MYLPGQYLVVRDDVIIGVFDSLKAARSYAKSIKWDVEIVVVLETVTIKGMRL